MVVVIETILSEIRDVEVGPAIVVAVADRDAEAPTLVGDAGFFGDVGEGAVVVVVQQHGARRGFCAFECRDG